MKESGGDLRIVVAVRDNGWEDGGRYDVSRMGNGRGWGDVGAQLLRKLWFASFWSLVLRERDVFRV